jgi:hypothetical protein
MESRLARFGKAVKLQCAIARVARGGADLRQPASPGGLA